MRELGAHSVAIRGVADAGDGNIFGDFDTWLADQLWPGMERIYGAQVMDNAVDSVIEAISELTGTTTSVKGQIQARVKEVRALTREEDRPKYHVELDLPEGTTYEVGDYLEVYPRNSEHDIEKLQQMLKMQGYDEPEHLASVIGSKHELNQPASAKVRPSRTP